MKIRIRAAFKEFRNSISSGFRSSSEGVASAFKSARSNLISDLETNIPKLKSVRKLDDISTPDIKLEKGEIKIGNTEISELEFQLEAGRFRKVYSELGLDGVISEKIEKSIQDQMGNVPAKRIADLEEEIAKLKKGKMKEYDIPIDKAKEELSETQKNKLVRHYKNVLSLAVGTTIAGSVVGIVAFGIDELIQECHKAKGCFLFTYESGEAGRCKLQNRSCAYSDHPHRIPHCDSKIMDQLRPNLNLVIRYLKKYKDFPTLLQRFNDYLVTNFPIEAENIITTFAKIENGTITNEEIENFIERPGFEEKMNEFCNNNKSSFMFTNFCDLLNDKERTETACVACSPSAPHNSIEYVNIEDLPEAVRPRCDKSPTLWEAFAKIAGDTPRDVADAMGLTELWKIILKWLGVFIGVMVIFIGVGYIVYMYRKKNGSDEISYSELENEDDEDNDHEHHEDEHHKDENYKDEHHNDEKKTEES